MSYDLKKPSNKYLRVFELCGQRIDQITQLLTQDTLFYTPIDQANENFDKKGLDRMMNEHALYCISYNFSMQLLCL